MLQVLASPAEVILGRAVFQVPRYRKAGFRIAREDDRVEAQLGQAGRAESGGCRGPQRSGGRQGETASQHAGHAVPGAFVPFPPDGRFQAPRRGYVMMEVGPGGIAWAVSFAELRVDGRIARIALMPANGRIVELDHVAVLVEPDGRGRRGPGGIVREAASVGREVAGADAEALLAVSGAEGGADGARAQLELPGRLRVQRPGFQLGAAAVARPRTGVGDDVGGRDVGKRASLIQLPLQPAGGPRGVDAVDGAEIERVGAVAQAQVVIPFAEVRAESGGGGEVLGRRFLEGQEPVGINRPTSRGSAHTGSRQAPLDRPFRTDQPPKA